MHRLLTVLMLALCTPAPAYAWGNEGHEAIALIARSYLTPAARARVDATLASDSDPLTASDLAARATWADVWRGSHRFTASWHFADIELDGGSLDAACFGFPPRSGIASKGPTQDCAVAKIEQFTRELRNPATSEAERRLALKFVLHFVGDVHQPLHAADHQDRGGNCVRIALGGTRTVNLHSYWDTVVVSEIAPDAQTLATTLRGRITPAQFSTWSAGSPRDWARESFALAKSAAYTLGSPAGCDRDAAPIPLPNGYDARARAVAAIQIERAGVRLARLLNDTFNHQAQTDVAPAPAADTPRAARSPASIACSEQADQRNLHGKERRAFRRRCLRG
nr:S1/P1 nuclease [uncultured Sphingomonas sp.]